MSPSWRRRAPGSMRSIAPRWPPAARITASRVCARIITPITTGPSCSTSTATISRRCATHLYRKRYCARVQLGSEKVQVGSGALRIASRFFGSFSFCQSYGLRTSLWAKLTRAKSPLSNTRLAVQVQPLSFFFFLPFLAPGSLASAVSLLAPGSPASPVWSGFFSFLSFLSPPGKKFLGRYPFSSSRRARRAPAPRRYNDRSASRPRPRSDIWRKARRRRRGPPPWSCRDRAWPDRPHRRRRSARLNRKDRRGSPPGPERACPSGRPEIRRHHGGLAPSPYKGEGRGGGPSVTPRDTTPPPSDLRSPPSPFPGEGKSYKPEKKSHSSFMLSTITVMAISTASPVTQ